MRLKNVEVTEGEIEMMGVLDIYMQPERVRGPPQTKSIEPDPDYLDFLASQS